MDGLQRSVRRVGSLTRSLSETKNTAEDPVETENLEKFQNEIGNYQNKLKELKSLYEHDFSSRLHALRKVQDILEHFLRVTNCYGEDFTMQSILEAWITYFTEVIRFVDRIVDSGTVKDNLCTSILTKTRVAIIGKTLIRLLDLRNYMDLLVDDFLKWTNYCGEKKFDVHIHRKSRTAAKLIDETVEEESDRLLGLGLDSVSNALAVELFTSLTTHTNEMDEEKLLKLAILKSRLSMVVALNSISSQSSRNLVQIDIFPNVNKVQQDVTCEITLHVQW